MSLLLRISRLNYNIGVACRSELLTRYITHTSMPLPRINTSVPIKVNIDWLRVQASLVTGMSIIKG